MAEVIVKPCPGAGHRGNLSDGYHANCAMCNARLPIVDGALTEHMHIDVLAMLNQGAFDA